MPASYRVRFHWRKAQTPFQNDVTFLTTQADGSFGEAVDIVAAIAGGSILTTILDCIPTDVTLEAVACSSVVMNGGSATPSSSAINVVNVAGTRTPSMGTGQTSNQNGPIISYQPTTLAGERARVCKIFLPTVNESDAEDDTVSPAMIGVMDAFAAALVAGFSVSSGAVAWVAALRISGVATVRAIAGYVSRTYVASQRRRRPAVLT
jgi:hypothetical protein